MDRKLLLREMPANGRDIDAARRLLQRGYPVLAPVLKDLANWMRLAKSPVADCIAEFFAQLGEPGVEVIGTALMRENCWLRRRILVCVLPHWPPSLLSQVHYCLTVITTQPDAYDNDLRSAQLLLHSGMVDKPWLEGWLAFKRQRWQAREALLTEIEQTLAATTDDSEP